MRLLEYQGRGLLSEADIALPAGSVAESGEEAYRIADEELHGRAVVKAQVPVGGRGKAGGIKITENPEEARTTANELLGSSLKGKTVDRVLLVEPIEIEQEYYVSVLLDRERKGPVVIFSPEGGVDIEEVAARNPEAIYEVTPDPLIGLQSYMIRELLYRADVKKENFKEFYGLIEKLYSVYEDFGATLVEINPVALTGEGELTALDSKLKIDDDSRATERIEELLPGGVEEGNKTSLEKEAEAAGLQYVELDGDIGIIGNGAGLVMSTLDVLSQKGGDPANFLDVGGGANAELMKKAYEVVTAKEDLAGIFVNIFGGITRCDEIASGIVQALESAESDYPLVVRLTGTNEEKGRRVLRENGLTAAGSLEEGAEEIMNKKLTA
jgi:succinyl-CoA synthetase beta subunit